MSSSPQVVDDGSNKMAAALRILAELLNSQQQPPQGGNPAASIQLGGAAVPSSISIENDAATAAAMASAAAAAEEVGWIWWLLSPLFALFYYAFWGGIAFGAFKLLKKPHMREMIVSKAQELVGMGGSDGGDNSTTDGGGDLGGSSRGITASPAGGGSLQGASHLLQDQLEEMKQENASLKNQLKKLQNRELATRQHLLSAMDGARRSEKKMQGADEMETARDEAVEKLAAKEQEARDITAYSSLLETQVFVLENQLREVQTAGPTLRSLQAAGTISKTAQAAIQQAGLNGNGNGGGGGASGVHVSVAEELQGKNEVLVVLVGQKEKQIERLGDRVAQLHDHIRKLEAELWAATHSSVRSSLLAGGGSVSPRGGNHNGASSFSPPSPTGAGGPSSGSSKRGSVGPGASGHYRI